MFLLNPITGSSSKVEQSIFTSHYVPIKSGLTGAAMAVKKYFTSHYVPIKSKSMVLVIINLQLFTSHYVPIKS